MLRRDDKICKEGLGTVADPQPDRSARTGSKLEITNHQYGLGLVVHVRAMKAAGRVNLGGFEIDLSDRVNPGSRFTDIVYVGSDGRILR